MKTEFPLYLTENFSFDIFGSQRIINEGKDNQETIVNKGLLQKDLRQPIKIHLKRLGNKLMEETKTFKEQMKSLQDEMLEKVEGESQLKFKEGFTIEILNAKAKELAETKVEIEHFDFKLEDFDFKGDEIYEFVDFITKEKEEN